VQVQLSALDSMLGPAAIHSGQQVRVVARLSAAARAEAGSGDLYGQLDYRAGKDGERQLSIDQTVP